MDIFESDPDASVHSAAEFILRTSGNTETVKQAISNCAAAGNWRIMPNGLCMIRFEEPGTVDLGATPATDDADGLLSRRPVRIDYAFEMSSTEVTVQQMHEYVQSTQPSAAVSFSQNSPIGRVTLFEAMKFCRLLSEQEPDFNGDQCCYPSVSEIHADMQLPRGFLLMPGYRLPTVHEWEYVARADSNTSRFFGNSPDLLDDYAWWVHNSEERLWPVGMKRPNPWGLFDVFGNAFEWCHEAEIDFLASGHPVRGGAYSSTQRFLRSSFKDFLASDLHNPAMGFRVVKVVK
jgi:formylglycine-generating enzyme required for sulfatase activity